MTGLFSRKSLGVSISASGISFVQTGGTFSSPQLERVSYRPLPPGSIRCSLIEPNVLDVPGFVGVLKEARNLLLCRGNHVSLALPDQAGHVMLLETEQRIRTHAEGLDIIKWKLRKKLPIDTTDIHLDYQEVMTRSNGDVILLVALMSIPVIRQYEELLAAAGLEAIRIDFNFFNLLRVFERRLRPLGLYGLVTFFDTNLGVTYFSEGRPEFIRVRDLSGPLSVDERVQKEIKCSVLSYRNRHPEREIHDIFFIAPPDASADFSDIIRDETGVEPVQLDTGSEITLMDNLPSDKESLFPYTAAIGASLRGF